MKKKSSLFAIWFFFNKIIIDFINNYQTEFCQTSAKLSVFYSKLALFFYDKM